MVSVCPGAWSTTAASCRKRGRLASFRSHNPSNAWRSRNLSLKAKGGKAPTGAGIDRLGTGPDAIEAAPGVLKVRMLADEGARDRLMIEGEGGGASPLIVPAFVARVLMLVPAEQRSRKTRRALVEPEVLDPQMQN